MSVSGFSTLVETAAKCL